MFDKLLDLGVSAFKSDPQANDRAQVQLERTLEKRFDACMELWRDLWAFVVKADNRTVERTDMQSLAGTLEQFLKSSGMLVSFDCFKALLQLRSQVSELNSLSDDTAFQSGVPMAFRRLMPHTETQSGKSIASPGLLMLLREQVGANMNSVSSAL